MTKNKEKIEKRIQELKDYFDLYFNIDGINNLGRLRSVSPKWLGVGNLEFEKTSRGIKKLYIDDGAIRYNIEDEDGGILESCVALIKFSMDNSRVEELHFDIKKDLEIRKYEVFPKSQSIHFGLVLILNKEKIIEHDKKLKYVK